MRSLLAAPAVGFVLIAAAAGHHHPSPHHGWHCNLHPACAVRVEHKRWRRVVAPYQGWLDSTSSCESGGNYRTNTGNGFYGGLQFTLSSWAAVGGRGLPSAAGRLEQEYRAILLRRVQGVGAWPVCGR